MTDNVSLSEKRRTLQNSKNEILEARVIANYGDPGLDEDYHFDILSRYVIVMIESCQRVPTSDKYAQMIALVKRPEALWITAASKPDGNTVNQKRMDAKGNVSVGIANGYSVNGIPRIYPAYSMGEVIKIKKLNKTIQPPTDTYFYSAFSTWSSSTWHYGSWHTDGSTLSYFKTPEMKSQLQQKTIEPIASNLGYFMGILFKMQWEAFYLSLNQGNSQLSTAATKIFDASWDGNQAVYSANGGYCFGSSRDRVSLNYLGYEDINIGQKARVATNECIPMVVTTPFNFPAPSARAIGTVQYNPTYSPIAR